jgi:aspartyl protease
MMQEPKFRFSNNSARITIPFEFARNGLFFQVRVNGSELLWFTLDSGSGATYLDLGVARKIGLEFSGTRKVHGAGKGVIQVQVAENVSFKLPGLLSQGHQIHAIDLAGVQDQWGRRLDGLFGYDFLERFVAVIDYEARRLTIMDPSGFEYKGPGEIFPIEFNGHLPFVKARIKVPGNPSEESLFLVDTGSQDEVDHPLIAKSRQTTRTTVGVGLGRASVGVFGPVETLQFAKFQLHNLSGVAGEGLGSKLIGGGVLHRFRIIFDYSRQRMIVEQARES